MACQRKDIQLVISQDGCSHVLCIRFDCQNAAKQRQRCRECHYDLTVWDGHSNDGIIIDSETKTIDRGIEK